MKASLNIPAGFDVDACVNWAIDNCASFDVYRIIELTWEDKQVLDCWFRLEIEFKDAADATLFNLRWS